VIEGWSHPTLPPNQEGGYPCLNGKVERSHRIDMEEFYRVRRAPSYAELAKAGTE
jgi:hypothetical protein